MKLVYADITINYLDKTWTCSVTTAMCNSRFSSLSKEYYERYPSDFCSQLNIDYRTQWETISNFKIIKVENIGFRDAE